MNDNADSSSTGEREIEDKLDQPTVIPTAPSIQLPKASLASQSKKGTTFL